MAYIEEKRTKKGVSRVVRFRFGGKRSKFFSTPLTRAATPKTPDVARLGFPRQKNSTNRSTGKRGFTLSRRRPTC